MKNLIATALAIGLFSPILTKTASAANGVASVIWRSGQTNVSPGQSLKLKQVAKALTNGKIYIEESRIKTKIEVKPNSEFSVVVSQRNKDDRGRYDGSESVTLLFSSGSGFVNVPPLNNPRSSVWVISPKKGWQRVGWKQACNQCNSIIDPDTASITKINAFNNATSIFIEQSGLRTVGVVKGNITETSGGASVPMSKSMYVRYLPGRVPEPKLADRSLAAHNLKIFPDQSILVSVNPGNKIIHQGIDLGDEARLNYGSFFSVSNPLGDSQEYFVWLTPHNIQKRRSLSPSAAEMARGAGQLVY